MARSTWPSETYYLYHEIKDYQESLYGMVSQALEESNRRFVEIPQAVVPVIKIQIAKIRASAETLIEMFENKSPRTKETAWYKISKDIEEYAAFIQIIVKEDLESALNINDMDSVWAGLMKVEEYLIMIKRDCKQIRAPMIPTIKRNSTSTLSVWDQADEVVERAVRKLER